MFGIFATGDSHLMLHFCFLLFLARKCQGTTYCSNEYECASLSLNDDQIYCRGFASCIYAQTIVSSTSGIRSLASYSSYGAASVISGADSACYGDSSCANISHFETKYETYCHGYRSCVSSTISRTSSTNSYSDIYFYGDESGAFTRLNLNQNTNIFANGRLSMYNSHINMYKSSRLWTHGVASLSGAKLYCEFEETCEIYCYDYGCYNVSSKSGDGIDNGELSILLTEHV